MPKGRGANKYKKGKKLNPRGAPAMPKGILGKAPASEADLRKRAQAAEAGGLTREQRRRSRQRAEEAARLAARRIARAANKSQGRQ